MAVSIRASLAIACAAIAAAFVAQALAEPPSASDATPCATGSQQSPIDLSHAIAAGVDAPHGHWSPTHGGLVLNTGSTIEVDLEDAGGLELDGVDYTLKQFHFHHPSEHTIDGRVFPMELHLVHAAPDGRMAVIGVLFEEGAALPALDPVWATAPGRTGKAAVAFEIDAQKLLPTSTSAYRYEGSLTTPPCSETVSWTVMAEPLTASHAQIEAVAALFPNNARPVQPINRRFLLRTD